MPIKFSVIIPTRSRAEYLKACLLSVTRAADRAGCEVEILVSDNASDDNTRDVVASVDHAAIRYVHRPERMSMRMNFEAALGEATGTHLIFIGDDDAVLPNGLLALRRFLEETKADIVNWNLPVYSWPDPTAGEPGYLKIAPGKVSGRAKKVDVDDMLSRILAGAFRSYHHGPVSYHGCVSRRIVDRGRETSEGTYFWCSSPDVFAAMRNLMIEDISYWKVDLPITLGGASPRSNGRSGQRMSRDAKGSEGSEFTRFIAESKDDPCNGRLPTDCPSLSLITLDALQMALKFEGRDDRIDLDAWQARIAAEVGSMTEAHRISCAAHAETLLGRKITIPERKASKLKDVAPDQSDALKGWPARAILIGSPEMADVALAAEALDKITGLEGRDVTPGIAGQLWSVLQTAGRARKAVRQAQSNAR